MIHKTKEALKKLEIGMLEVFLGALIIIGLLGYFYHVPADLDWLDHTISFILFSYLFYKMDITSIIFGKSHKAINLLIILSYFSIFFKGIVFYTADDSFRFHVLTFVDSFYRFMVHNLFFTKFLTFYLGITGLLAASFIVTKKIEIRPPSFLYAATHNLTKKRKLVKFIIVFSALIGFYYFVYNTLLEWLEFVLDDPIIFVGIIYFITKVAKHKWKFNSKSFIFKIGDISSGIYSKFISLFHYKHTLSLAISGLVVLHALSDFGVFFYSYAFNGHNAYLDELGSQTTFLEGYRNDMTNLSQSYKYPLALIYILNALSLAFFFIIPIIIWAHLFLQRTFHIRRFFLPFIYASFITYLLIPAYSSSSITTEGPVGVKVTINSVLNSSSLIRMLFSDAGTRVLFVSIIAVLAWILVYAFSSRSSARREFYAVAILASLIFHLDYIFKFFMSTGGFFVSNILDFIYTPHFAISMTFLILLVLSIFFYFGGYFMFVYEIVMEYRKKKWSEPIDESAFRAFNKFRKAGNIKK